MDKESKLSAAVQPFFPRFHRSDDDVIMAPVRGELATASPSSPPPVMRLPNPYLNEQRARRYVRDEVVVNPRQRSPATDAVQQGSGGENPSKHGYSSSRRVRGTADARAYPSKENRSIRDPQSKTSKYNSDSSSQERRHGKKSLDASRRVVRDARSAPNSVDRPKSTQSDSAAFEVRMADFPELGIRSVPGSPFVPVQQKACWGPAPESPSTEIRRPAVSTNKTLLTRSGPPAKHEPRQCASDAKSASSAVLAGQPTRAGSPSNGSGPVVSSWANVASQPPKAPAPKERTVNGNSGTKKLRITGQKEATQEESVLEKRKQQRKKKKKGKSGGEDEEVDPDEAVVQQEPPKFEDEEEFPGLAVAKRSVASSNTTKLCNEPSQREGVQLQQGDHQNKDKATGGITLPTDATKKAQKAVQSGGKKSKVPVQLDIGNMLAALEKKQQSHKDKQEAKPVTLSVGGALPAACHKPAAAQKKLPWQQDKIAHNPLDSTSPMVKKGKQREVPKAKKPTPLKRVILKEREERKQNRLLEERGLLPGQEEQPRAADQTATEEQCDPSDTDEISSPTGPEDEPEGHHESNQTEEPMEGEGEEEEEEEAEEEGGREQTNTQIQAPVLVCHDAPKIHSRKFRDYCSQVLSKDVDECVTTLLKELVRFQDRLYQKDPMKARMKRRLVMGLREVLKHLKLRKVKCVVISPNCERSQSKGGLDEALHNIINTCREQGVPFVFALSRKALGRCVNKAVPVSLVGIFNYDGAQDFYHKMIELSSEARRAYEVMVENLELAGQEEEENLGEHHDTAATDPPDTSQEPEYIQLWKTVLEKECNHKFLNFEDQLSSMRLASDGTEQSDECEQS